MGPAHLEAPEDTKGADAQVQQPDRELQRAAAAPAPAAVARLPAAVLSRRERPHSGHDGPGGRQDALRLRSRRERDARSVRRERRA